jgi:ATP phosphoribosyltransferase
MTVDLNKTPETINQMIDYVSGVKKKVQNNRKRKEIQNMEQLLKKMKQAPEHHNACALDFKIDNPNYYLDKIRKIIENDG